MVHVVDLECELPRTSGSGDDAYVRAGRRYLGMHESHEDHGLENYGRIFSSREYLLREDLAEPHGRELTEIVQEMDQAGVERAVPLSIDNADIANAIDAFPQHFLGLAYISPFDGMRGVRELEFLIRERGFSGLRTSAMNERLPANDRRYYPLYSKCVELGVPVRLYSTMNYSNDRPYDLGHPRYIDEVAVDFPELTIIAGLGGWPWVNDMVSLMRRHPKLYCDTGGHRPRHLATPGSGWDMLLQFGNTLLQDKVLVGLSSQLLGTSMSELIQEYVNLPLKEHVLEKWLYANAANIFQL